MNNNKIYCFTPLVSLGTFLLEVIFALYTFYKYRKTKFGIISMFVLLSLASFQLPEYLLCKDSISLYSNLLIQIAFIGTTFLPVFGFHLINLINNNKQKILLILGYISAVVVSFFIIKNGGQDLIHQCTGKYVRFELETYTQTAYYFNYLIFVGISIFTLLYRIFKKENSKIDIYMLLAFCVFIVPSQILYWLSFFPRNGLPSVACGFAMLTAVILIGKVLPLYHKDKVI